MHIVSEQSADTYKALDDLLSNLLGYLLLREKEEKNYALRKEIADIYDDVKILREFCTKYYNEQKTDILNLILAIFYPAIAYWTEQFPKRTQEIEVNLLLSLNKKRSDSTQHDAPNFKNAEKIKAEAEERAKEKFFSSMPIRHYPSITRLKDAITIAFVDASGDKPTLIPEICVLLDTIQYNIAEFCLPFKPFLVFSFSESYNNFDEYSFLSKEEKTTVENAFKVWLDTFRSLNNNFGSWEAIEKTQYENSTIALISNLLENAKISFDRLRLFYLLLNHNHEQSAICCDILDRLKEYAASSEDCYIISMLEYLTFYYNTPSVIVNWLSWQKEQRTVALKTREELFAANSTALNGMKGYLTNLLIKTISKPIIMEAVLNRSFSLSIQVNQYHFVSSHQENIYTDSALEGAGPSALTYKRILQNLNPDIADIRSLSNTAHDFFIFECNQTQKGFVSKLLTPEIVSLLSVGKQDKSSRKYSFSNILYLLQSWLKDTDLSYADQAFTTESFVMLTGYNVCAELVYGLQKICIYKDSFNQYELELDLLIKELVRYMRVLGSQTALLLHEILFHLKEANTIHKLWKFSRKNYQNGCSAIHLIYELLHSFSIEELTNELEQRYISVLCPDGFEKKEQDLAKYVSDPNDPDDLQHILNTFGSSVVAAANHYNVAGRTRELEKASSWKNYKITDEAWNSDAIKGISADPRDKYPTNTAGRWYCHLQQMFIKELNR